MKIAVTGATGFIGHYIVVHLLAAGHSCRCWFRPGSDQGGFDAPPVKLEWMAGELGDDDASRRLMADCDAVVHGALYHPGGGFREGEGNLIDFVEKNVVGSIRLIEAARSAGVDRFVFISSCAVHEKILDDRPLDETHPTWAMSHYGAHKAAIEQFVHSYGFGQGYPICGLRPTGVYGVARPPEHSKWYKLVQAVVRGEPVECTRGGKEVHAQDVAKAAAILLTADGIAGEVYNCYDRYVAEAEVAEIAKRLSGSSSQIHGQPGRPKHEIVTAKLRALGMRFGGGELLERTIGELVEHARAGK